MRLADPKGFTIIEIMIAMAIFSIGILAVAQLQVSSTGYNTKSRIYTEAATFATAEIEALMNVDYADIADGQRTDGIYEIAWVVTPQVTDPDTSDANVVDMVKRIHVTVTWPTRDDNPGAQFEATYYKAVTY